MRKGTQLAPVVIFMLVITVPVIAQEDDLVLSGGHVVDSQSFLVADSEGPLEDGELDRAREWAAGLASSLAPSVS